MFCVPEHKKSNKVFFQFLQSAKTNVPRDKYAKLLAMMNKLDYSTFAYSCFKIIGKKSLLWITLKNQFWFNYIDT